MMNNRYLTLPSLRQDIAIELHEDENEKLIVLYDPHGYAEQPIALPVKLYALLQLFDGKRTIDDLSEMLTNKNGEKFDKTSLLHLINSLDSLGYLESEAFHEYKQNIQNYLDSAVRPGILAGNSFPEEPEELDEYLKQILESASAEGISPKAKAIIAPHIDFRIGERAHEVYSKAYRAIEESNPDLVVILGTSHYRNSSLFMLTEKDYSTPLGIIETDKSVIKELQEKAGGLFQLDDMAHKNEHSIELQAALLQKKYEGKNFKILPVLTGSLLQYRADNKLPEADKAYTDFFEALNEIVEAKGLKTIYIASADLSHIGRKFGDEFNAEPVLPLIESEDKELIKAIVDLNHNKFFSLISETNDNRKVCGFSPVYGLLYAAKAKKGQFLDYHQWNETDTFSAVSFASLAFWD